VKIKNLTKEISEIYERIVDGETSADLLTAKVHPSYRLSAKNLYRYLILRNFDLRKYHDSLSDIGVSSLRSSEGYVFNNLHNVIRNLKLIQGINTPKETGFEVVGYKRGKHLLQRHTRLLFNDKQLGHYTEIMVTLPSEAATNKLLIEKMVAKGMDVARINLSHDNEQTWTAMVRHLKEIEATTGKRTAIFMDLTGPKIRTGKITRTSKKGKNRDYLKIKKGNNLVLVKAEREIDPELQQSQHLAKNKVPVQLPKIIDALQIGEPVYFDDGMIKAIVTEKSVDSVTVQIQEAYKTRLGSEKGINIPSTKLNLPSLTKRDLALLPFATKHADIIG
jgi:pyruvate kinase